MKRILFRIIMLLCCVVFAGVTSAAVDDVTEMTRKQAYEDLVGKLSFDLGGPYLSTADIAGNLEWKLLEARDLTSEVESMANLKYIEYKLEFRFKDELLYYCYCVEKEERGFGYIGFHIDKLPDFANSYTMDSKKVVLRDDYEPLAEYWHDNILYKKVPGADVVFKVYGKLKFRKSIDGWESIGVHGTALSIDERYSEMRFSDKDANGRVFRNKLHSVFAGKKVMHVDSEEHKDLLSEYENRFASARKRFLDYCAKYEAAKEKKSSTYKLKWEVQKKYNLASREKGKAEGILRDKTRKYDDAVKKLQQSKDKFNKVLRDSKEKNRGKVFDRVSGALMQAEKKLKTAQSDLDAARKNMEQKEKHFLDVKAEFDEAKRVEKESREYFVNMPPPWSYTEKHE